MRLYMKQFHWFLLIAVFAFLFISNGCTIRKRLHRKGWHIEWHSHKKSGVQTVPDNEATDSKNNTKERNSSVALQSKAENTYSQPEAKNLIKSEPEKKSGKTKLQSTDVETSEHKEKTGAASGKRDSGIEQRNPHEPMSPPKIPVTAWVFLALGVILLGAGLVIALAFAVVNSTLIGLPTPVILMIAVGVVFLILAYNRAVNPTRRQTVPRDPPTKSKEEFEKKERQPMKKGDKIFLAVIGALLLGIGITLIVY